MASRTASLAALAIALAFVAPAAGDNSGKIGDDDYRAQVGALRRRAAETLRALEDARGG